MFWNLSLAPGFVHLLDEAVAIDTGLNLIRIEKHAVRKLTLGHLPRVAKLIKLTCVDIRFDDGGIDRIIRVFARQGNWSLRATNQATLEIYNDLKNIVDQAS